jgi:hypothetical protein
MQLSDSAKFAVNRATLQRRVVFLLFKSARCLQAFLIARGDVPRRGFPFGAGLCAFQNDGVSWHWKGDYSLIFAVIK